MPPKGWKRQQLIKFFSNRAEVVLGRGGGIAIVDLCDVPLIREFSWFRNDSGYAVRKEVPRRMHRLIMGDPAALIDHKNRNRLDNRRNNLRLCNKSENAHNSTPRKGGIKQVGNRWRARIVVHKREIHLGYFDTQEEALFARRNAEIKYFGEFAPNYSSEKKR